MRPHQLKTGKKKRISEERAIVSVQYITMSPQTVVSSVERNEDIFYEILKHLDAKTLALAACVNRRWRHAAEDETLWENVCTRNWPASSSRAGQLRSVVLALGGFRRLYVLCLRPLLSRPHPPVQEKGTGREWSKDEVHLSLSLFSIDCYERLGRRYCQQSPLKLFCKPPAECAGFSLERLAVPSALPGVK